MQLRAVGGGRKMRWLLLTLLLSEAIASSTVSICTQRAVSVAAAARQSLAAPCRQDATVLLDASHQCGRLSVTFCDQESMRQRPQQAESDVVAIPGTDGELGSLEICVERVDGTGVIERRDLRLRLLHGLLLLVDYDPTDPERRGSIAATGGDGEVREMAVAERTLLRRLGWQGEPHMCSCDSRHGHARGEYKPVEWGLAARGKQDAWWLHDLHSHEGRRWRSAAMKRFVRVCGQ